MKTINLSFTYEQISILNKALIQLPYGEVVNLISDINQQIDTQQNVSNSEDE